MALPSFLIMASKSIKIEGPYLLIKAGFSTAWLRFWRAWMRLCLSGSHVNTRERFIVGWITGEIGKPLLAA